MSKRKGTGRQRSRKRRSGFSRYKRSVLMICTVLVFLSGVLAVNSLRLQAKNAEYIEQEEELASPSEARSGQEIIGTWANDRPYMANRIVLYREEGTTFSVERYADGSELEHEVSVAQTDRGTRYEKPNSHGDHFLVLPSGALEIRDDEGLITSLRPVQ